MVNYFKYLGDNMTKIHLRIKLASFIGQIEVSLSKGGSSIL